MLDLSYMFFILAMLGGLMLAIRVRPPRTAYNRKIDKRLARKLVWLRETKDHPLGGQVSGCPQTLRRVGSG